jgi:Phosphoribosyl-dephospho-CoA transferase MdcG
MDVLFECSKDTQLHKLFAELQTLAGKSPRLDGEISATNGWAVAWRELAAALQAQPPVKLLAKSYSETRLLSVEQLFEQQLSDAA